MKKGIGIILLSGIACSILISCSHTSSTSTNGSTSTTVEQKSTPVSNAAEPSAGVEGKPTDSKPSTDMNPPNQPVEPKSGESVQPKEKQSTVKPGTAGETVAAPAPISQITPTNQTAPSASTSETPPVKPPVDAVTLSIVGDKARGVILPAQAVTIQQGDTVLDVLSRVLKNQKIQMEYSGVKATAYVKGIDNLYEFDDGPKSGWMFKVNGKVSDRSAGAYALNPGDTVEWLYTLDLGKDIGAK